MAPSKGKKVSCEKYWQFYIPTGSSMCILSKKGTEKSVKKAPITPTKIDSHAENKKQPAGKLNCNHRHVCGNSPK